MSPTSTDASGDQGFTNRLLNGSFEQWGAGAPLRWTLSNGSAAQDTGIFYLGAASVALTRAGTDMQLSQDAVGDVLPLTYIRGRQFTLSVRARKDAGKKARLKLDDGVGSSSSGYACETGEWQLLSVTRTVDLAATRLLAILEVFDVDGTVRFDAAMLTEGLSTPAYSDNPVDSVSQINPNPPAVPTGLLATAAPLTVTLTWNANTETDIDYYEVQRADNVTFTLNLVNWKVKATRYEDTLSTTSTRWYRVRAVRVGGATSNWCNSVSQSVVLIGTAHIANAAITNAKIGNLEVDSAKIANLTIGTGKITDLAVSIDGVYENNAQIIVVGETEIGSLTISAGGGSVLVLGSARCYSQDSANVRMRKDSITGTIMASAIIGTNMSITLVARDGSPAATQTYVLTAQLTSGSQTGLENRKLYTLNRKK